MHIERESPAARNLLMAGFEELPHFPRKRELPLAAVRFAYPVNGRHCVVFAHPAAGSVTVLYDTRIGYNRLCAEIGEHNVASAFLNFPALTLTRYCRALVQADWTPEMKGHAPRLSITHAWGSKRADYELTRRGSIIIPQGIEVTSSPAPLVVRDERGDYAPFAREMLQGELVQ